MPLYEYCCETHGKFDAFTPLAEYKSAAACPICGEESPRVLSLPLTRVLNGEVRIGMEINEKSQHEPRRYSDHADRPPTPKRVEKLQQSSGARPWMVG